MQKMDRWEVTSFPLSTQAGSWVGGHGVDHQIPTSTSPILHPLPPNKRLSSNETPSTSSVVGSILAGHQSKGLYKVIIHNSLSLLRASLS